MLLLNEAMPYHIVHGERTRVKYDYYKYDNCLVIYANMIINKRNVYINIFIIYRYKTIIYTQRSILLLNNLLWTIKYAAFSTSF
jgi:hypothetical protein